MERPPHRRAPRGPERPVLSSAAMRHLLTYSCLVLALGGCAATATSAQAAAPARVEVARTESLTVEDVVALRSVRDVAISPDGKHVAYALRVPPGSAEGRGHGRNVIWIVPTRGGEPQRFTVEDPSSQSPTWSPDGRWLAFRSKRSGDAHAQVYRISPRGGEAQRITSHPSGVTAFAWSPDGRSVAYLADRVDTSKEKEAKREGHDWRVGDVTGKFRRLWRVDVEGGESTALTPREVHVEAFRWSPRGERIAVQVSDRPDVDAVMMYSRLATLPAEGGPLRPLAKTEGKLGDFVFSPDGDRVAFLGAIDIHDPTAGVLHVAAVNPEAGEATARALTADLQGTGKWVRWPSRDAIVLLANTGTRTTLHRVSPQDAKVATLQRGDGPVCQAADLSSDGRTFTCAGSSATHPPEVFTGPVAGKLVRRTHSNPELDGKHLGAQSVVRWLAHDELEIEGVLIRPVGFEEGKRYPLAVLVHGGPEGISLDGWETRSGYPAQVFANRGYVVLMPNYRGSQGRGVAFGKADHGDLGGSEFSDVLAGIDHLVQEGLVDPDRVGMGGWSYGGYFSGLAATRHSDRFKAAMVGAAITNWISFTGTTEIEHENSLVHWKLWPWDEHELAWERSPLAHTKGSKTATLIVHGDADTRVPPGQALELYRALRHHGTTTEVVLYPRAGHGLGERAHQIDFANRFVDWFDRHVKGEPEARAVSDSR
jgi:dipeptidyl aminopeptidase/acylaminoacyl peptidase